MRESKEDTKAQFTISTYEFGDNEHFMDLNNLVTRLDPSNVVVHTKALSDEKFAIASEPPSRTGQRRDVELKQFKREREDISSELKRLLGVDTLIHHHSILDRGVVLNSLGALLNEIRRVLREQAKQGSFELVECNLDTYMRLDRSAVHALNLFPDPFEKGANKYSSLIGVLDHCVTAGMGRRLLRRWLRQPLRDAKKIRERQNLVEVFVTNDILRQSLQEGPLRGVLDIPKTLRKLHESAQNKGKKLDSSAKLKELYLIYRMAFELPDIVRTLESLEDKETKKFYEQRLLAPLRKISTDLKGLMDLCEHVIDLKRAEMLPAEYVVDPYNCAEVCGVRSLFLIYLLRGLTRVTYTTKYVSTVSLSCVPHSQQYHSNIQSQTRTPTLEHRYFKRRKERRVWLILRTSERKFWRISRKNTRIFAGDGEVV